MINIRVIRIFGLAALLASGTLSAQTLIPNVFQSDQPALAVEVNANFASLDQAVVGLLQSSALRTVVVSPIPGNAVASGTALRDALAEIDSPAADNRYLLKLEPGDYDLGGGGLTLREYVDVEGSGRGMTNLSLTDSSITLVGNVEIRGLAVDASYGNGGGGGIAIPGATVAVAVVTDLKVTVTGTGGNLFGIGAIAGSKLVARNIEVSVNGGSSTAGVFGSNLDVAYATISAGGATFFNRPLNPGSGSSTFLSVTATATGNGARAIQSTGAVSLINSRLISDDLAVVVEGVSGAAVNVANSQLVGSVSGSNLTVVGCYDGNFAPIADTL